MTFTPSRDPVLGTEGAPPLRYIWREGCEEEAKEWPEFDDAEAAWHGPLGEIVHELDPETEADPKAVGIDLLISFGNIIGASAHFRVGGSHHDGRLFAVTVGKSAKARKGTSQDLVMAICRHLEPDWSRHRQLRGIASGEAMVDFAAGKIQSHDDEPYVDEFKRVMIREGEFSRLLAASNRENSTLSGVMRDAWDQHYLSTVSRTATSKVEGAHVSMSAHITAFELDAKLSQSDVFNGFANRCLWVMVRRSKLLPSGGNLSDRDFAALADMLRGPVKLASNAGRMVRTPKAEALWRVLYEGPLAEDGPGVVGTLTARAEPQVIRLSLLFALLDSAPKIDVAHVEQAYQWWVYSARSVAYLFGNPDDGLSADERKLLNALRSAGCTGLTQSDQFVKVFGRHRTAEQIRGIRERLAARSLIWTTATPGEGTRPVYVTWALVPGSRGDW